MNKNLIFYTNPQSRGQIVRWMLEETGNEYRQEIVEYGPQMKSPAFLSINPMGKVPAIRHGNAIVTECAAICAYLADAFPDSNLSPQISDRAAYYRWLFFAAGPLESAITNKSLGFDTDEQQQRMAGYGTYDLVVKVLDEQLGKSEYISGDSFTAADVYLGSHVDFGIMFGTISATANMENYVTRLRERSAYQSARKKDMALIQSD